MTVVGTAYIIVRPDLGQFASELIVKGGSAVSGAGAGLGGIPVRPDTKQWESDWAAAGSRVKGTLTQTLKMAGIGAGLFGAVDVVKSGFDELLSTTQQARTSTITFGQEGGQALSTWANTSVTALGKTKSEALSTANVLGGMLQAYGDSSNRLVQDTEDVTKRISDVASAKSRSVGDVQAAVEGAMKSGRTAAMRDLGIKIDDSDLKAMAEKMGMITPQVNDAKVGLLKAHLKSVQDEISKASQGADPRAVEVAQGRATAAQKAHAEAVLKFSANSQQALTTQNSMISAEMALDAARKNAIPDGDRVNSLKAEELDLQQQIDTASQGSLDTLSASQKAMAVYATFMQATSDATNDFGGTTKDKVTEAAKAWDEATASLAEGLAPELTDVATWVTSNGPELKDVFHTVGDDLGTAARYAGELIGWFSDHPDVTKMLGLGLVGFFAVKKGGDVVKDVTNVFSDVVTAYNKTIGRLPGLPTFGSGQKPSLPSGIAGSPMTVPEMTVVSMTVESMLGGGLGKGGPQILGPNGRPISSAEGAAAEGEGVLAAEAGATGGVLSRMGSALGAAASKAFVGLAVVGITDQVSQLLTGGRAASLFNPESYANFARGVTGKTGMSDLQNIATQAQNEGTFMGMGHTDKNKARDFLQGQITSPQMLDAISQGNADEIGKLSEWIKQNGFGDDIAQRYHDIAQAVATDSQSAPDKLKTPQQVITDALYDVKVNMLDTVSRLVGSELSDMQDIEAGLAGANRQLAQQQKQTSGSALVALNAGYGSVAPGGKTSMRSFGSGGPVEGSGLAYLHDNEYVEGVAERSRIDALLSGVQQLLARVGGSSGPSIVQQFSGFGEQSVADIAAREAQRVLRAYDDNRAAGRPAFAGMRTA